MNNDILLYDFNPIISEVNSSSVFYGTFRLDSQYYALFEDKIANLQVESYEVLSNCCNELYEVPPFKHIYVEQGIPFYTSSDLFNNEYIPSHFLTPIMPNIDLYKIKKGQVLMARSGNVEGGVLGQLLIVGELLDNATTSDHVLRFTVNESKINKGYFAAFLMSEFCKGQLLKNAAGAVIPAIRPESLKQIKIPILAEELQEAIGNNIINAVEKREKAISILEQARKLVLQYNNLPPLDENEIESLDPEKEIEIRQVSTEEFTTDYRLDAHFYNPMAKKAVENIVGKASNYSSLIDLVENIIIGKRFKRNYVESEHGTPFLSGKNIIQIRPSDLKYLSNTEISFINELIIKKNWTLITCSGTIGRTCFVYNNYEDYAASQHILRVIPNKEIIDPGYLYCFLSTDYGYHQILRYRYGAVIDEIDDSNLANINVPKCSPDKQKEIGDLVRKAYDLRAEAIQLEDEAQEILTEALTGK